MVSPPAGPRTLTAEPGQNVLLPCRAPVHSPVLAVEWTRADLESEYVFLYRDEQSVPFYQHPSFRNRVDLQDRRMKDGDVSLVLRDVTTGDRGTYECRVYQRGHRVRKRANLDSDPISTIVLDVAPPPPPGSSSTMIRNRRIKDQINRAGSVRPIAALLLSILSVTPLWLW